MDLREELETVLNRHREDSADSVLAEYLSACLRAFDSVAPTRERPPVRIRPIAKAASEPPLDQAVGYDASDFLT